MAKYSGTFQVFNNTGGTITNLVVAHSCGTYPTVTIKEASLDDKKSSPVSATFDSRTLYHDYWTISFTNDEGVPMTAYDHCSFSSDDDGDNVLITLAGQVTIAPSKTHSCTIAYHQS